jgi:DNA ligase-1
MKRFASCFAELDASTRTGDKVAALAAYFADAPPADAAWGLAFLVGRRPKRALPARRLAEWATAAAGIPDWLLAESLEQVGDLGECLALLLPDPQRTDPPPLHVLVERLLALQGLADDERRAVVERTWGELDAAQRLVWHKLLLGSFRVGVSQALVLRGLAQATGLPAATLAHRLAGQWTPSAAWWATLVGSEENADAAVARPSPFFLAHPLHADPATLGPPEDWLAEWKWDGIRGQLIRRGADCLLWSRGEEPIAHQFPEVVAAALALPPGTVLDGEVLAWEDDRPLPFAALQKRLGRKQPSLRLQREVPIAFCAYDLLELDGVDWRARPLRERRGRLDRLVAELDSPRIRCPAPLPPADWVERARLRAGSRDLGVEGLMLKRLDSPYGMGRTTGTWWKWKIDPHSVDAVLVYAQHGSGIRAGQYTDYTFAVWDGDLLVPVAKAYSGLTREEIEEVDRFVRAHTIERFGPVRAVEPRLVFELHFEGIRASTRHKSGLAVRFPRIARWRRDKPAAEADRLASLLGLAGAPHSVPDDPLRA